MKEIFVCEKLKDINYYFNLDNKEQVPKVEKVPETWEELKELCKGLKCNKSDLDKVIWLEFPKPKDTRIWLGKFLCLDIKGQVGIVEKTFGNDVSITIFATDRKPQQMWSIIKSLVEK